MENTDAALAWLKANEYYCYRQEEDGCGWSSGKPMRLTCLAWG